MKSKPLFSKIASFKKKFNKKWKYILDPNKLLLTQIESYEEMLDGNSHVWCGWKYCFGWILDRFEVMGTILECWWLCCATWPILWPECRAGSLRLECADTSRRCESGLSDNIGFRTVQVRTCRVPQSLLVPRRLLHSTPYRHKTILLLYPFPHPCYTSEQNPFFLFVYPGPFSFPDQ